MDATSASPGLELDRRWRRVQNRAAPRRTFGPDHVETATARARLGTISVELGRHAQAIEQLERALVTPELRPYETVETRFALARARAAIGDRALAEQLALQSATTARSLGGPANELHREIIAWTRRTL